MWSAVTGLWKKNHWASWSCSMSVCAWTCLASGVMKPSVNQANTDGFLSFTDASLSPVLFAPAPSLATQTHKLHLLNLLVSLLWPWPCLQLPHCS